MAQMRMATGSKIVCFRGRLEVISAQSEQRDCPNETRPFPLPRKLFDTMIRRGTSLFQFYCNVAVLYLDLCAWMMALNYLTLPCGLVIGLRLFDEVLVLPNYVFFTPSRNHFTTRGL
jgi:hypothetical protein